MSIQINSYTKDLGFAWTVAGDGEDDVPTQPKITGTIGQIRKFKKTHPDYLADQQHQRCERWFYQGQEIIKVQTSLYARGTKVPSEIDRLIGLLDKDGVFISTESQS